MKWILGICGAIIALILLGGLGLMIKPKPFSAFAPRTPSLETVPIPDDLPAPVERFYRTVYGDRVPVITSAVITGRAEMRPFGPITFPARFRFVHEAGQGYRHYIEATVFGIPVLRVNERYLDGHGRLELPFGIDEGERIDQGGNLGMWSESIWFPSIYLTDPRVRWEAVDADTANLVVPFGSGEQRYVVRFDPETGLTTWFESMRYHSSVSEVKVLWLNKSVQWGMLDGQQLLLDGAVTWMDDGKPWATFHVEDIVYNTDVTSYIRATGP